jgi:O-acetyl-ADP-ribose deacetylase (regulator of RNase III)
MPAKISFVKGDITEMAVDAIVNAANNDLILGAGVAGAIRRKGGPRIEEECERLGPIRLGEAAVTTGGKLKALYVIHAASMRLGEATTAESLRMSTRHSLLRAEEKTIKSIAFPAIGTGIAGFPMDECARIMITEVLEHLKLHSSLEKVVFVLYDDAALKVFEETYQRLAARPREGSKAGDRGSA